MAARENFMGAAGAVAACVSLISGDEWQQPGLGVWTVRELVGHTSRAIVTVLTYLERTASSEDVPTPEDYVNAIKKFATPDTDAQIAERGRQAGRDLGDDPAAFFAGLVREVREKLSIRDDETLLPTIAGGMRLGPYLETRTFELVVHGGDIARATGHPLDLPTPALTESCALAARVAVLQGQGPALLAALTGRHPLPPTFSLVTPE